MDASYELAEYIVQTKFEDLPDEVAEAAKINILDTMGVAVAGSRLVGGKKLMTLWEELGGKPESTIIGYGKKASSAFATLVNSSMAHAMDYDDVINVCGHIAVTVVPTAFAMAEALGNVNGKDLITAVVLGNDIKCRLGAASIPMAQGPGWLYSSMYGIFSSAVVAGKLLELNEEQMVDALGIAYSFVSGNRQPITDGALTKSMQAGFSAQSGVLSALLAKQDVSGVKNTFDGIYGLANVYHRGEFFREKLIEDLGKKYYITDMQYKKFPCCTGVESSAEAAYELVKEHGIKAEDVDHVTAHVGTYSRTCVEPLEFKQNPRFFVDAQFSVPWVIATALVKGRLTPDDMTEDSIENESVRAMANKVTPVMDMEVPSDSPMWPARVEVFMKNGEVYTKQIDFATGHPSVPMSTDELIEKFRTNVKYGKTPLDEATTEKALTMIMNLETVANAAEIMPLFG